MQFLRHAISGQSLPPPSKEDVLLGTMADADFAADLAQVLRGTAAPQYSDPVGFFSNTYPTRGLKNLHWNVCSAPFTAPIAMG